MADRAPDAPAQSPSFRERILRVMETPLAEFSVDDINGMSLDEIRTLCTLNNIIPGQKGAGTLRKKLLALLDSAQEQQRRALEGMPNSTQQDPTSPHQGRPPSLSSHEADSPPNNENEVAATSFNDNNAAPVVETVEEAS